MNPFVYGEITPLEAFVDREPELDRLVGDLASGQKVFLISPRRFGKSSLIRQALRASARRGLLTAEVAVSSYSSYVAFLEGFARTLLAVETRLDRLSSWVKDLFMSVHPEVRVEAETGGAGRFAIAFPAVRTRKDEARLAEEVFELPARIAKTRRRRLAIALDEFQAIAGFDSGSISRPGGLRP